MLSQKAEDEDTRVLAAGALGALGCNKRALKALMLDRDDLSDRVCFTVVNVLVSLKHSPEVHEILRSQVNDDGYYPGRPAIAALIHASEV